MSSSRPHDSMSQNLGNSLGARPCVRQTPLYKRHESGNAMKDLLGMSHLAWEKVALEDNCRGPKDPCCYVETPPPQPQRGGYPQTPTRPSPPSPPRIARTLFADPSRGDLQPFLESNCLEKQLEQFIDVQPTDMIITNHASKAGLQVSENETTTAKHHDKEVAVQQAASKHMKSTLVKSQPQQEGVRQPEAKIDSRSKDYRSNPRAKGRSSSVPAPPSRLSRSRFDGLEVAPAFGRSQRSVPGKARQAEGSAQTTSHLVEEYERGAIPCRLDHGTCSYRISWDVPDEELQSRRQVLLPLFADGICETRHPYATLASLAFKSLASLSGAEPLSSSSIRAVMVCLRRGIMQQETAASAMQALKQVAQAEGDHIAPHLGLVLPALGKRLFSRIARDREGAKDLLRHIARHGGEDAKKVMRDRGVSAGLA